MTAQRIDGHSLRILYAEVLNIVASECVRKQAAIRGSFNFNQLITFGIQDQKAPDLTIKSHIDWVGNCGLDGYRIIANLKGRDTDYVGIRGRGVGLQNKKISADWRKR